MKVSVKIHRMDLATVTLYPVWWRRWFFFAPGTERVAARTRYGWHWEDTSRPIINRQISAALDDALFEARGYR